MTEMTGAAPRNWRGWLMPAGWRWWRWWVLASTVGWAVGGGSKWVLGQHPSRVRGRHDRRRDRGRVAAMAAAAAADRPGRLVDAGHDCYPVPSSASLIVAVGSSRG